MKKTVSFVIVVSMISALFMLNGCDSKEATQAKAQEQAAQMKTAKAETVNQFIYPSQGTIRKPGQSGFKSF